MGLDAYQIGYFIAQVGLAASSFGVSSEDVTSVADALSGAFNVKCAPATAIDPAQGPQLQSICVADSCPEAPMGDCAPYGASAGEPLVANATLALGEGRNGTGSEATMSTSGKSGGATGPKPTGTGTSNSKSESSGATLLDANMWLGVLVGAAMLCIFSWWSWKSQYVSRARSNRSSECGYFNCVWVGSSIAVGYWCCHSHKLPQNWICMLIYLYTKNPSQSM